MLEISLISVVILNSFVMKNVMSWNSYVYLAILCVVAFTNMKLISAIFPGNYFCCTGFVWYSDNYSLLCMLFFHHDLPGCSSVWSVYFKVHSLINVCIQNLFHCVKPVVEEIITMEFNVLWGNFCLLWCSVFYTLRVRTGYLMYS